MHKNERKEIPQLRDYTNLPFAITAYIYIDFYMLSKYSRVVVDEQGSGTDTEYSYRSVAIGKASHVELDKRNSWLAIAFMFMCLDVVRGLTHAMQDVQSCRAW